jgi:hypothetical protein
MRVIIKGVPLDLPELEATLLIQKGVAHLQEQSTLDQRTRFEPSGIPMPPGQEQATDNKPSKRSKGSRKTATKSPSTRSTGSKGRRQSGTE